MKKIVLLLSLIGIISSCQQSPPPSKEVAYFGTISPDSAFIIFYDRDSFAAAVDYSNFRCLLGTPDSLKEYKIIDVTRLRDGGTTWVTIEDNRGAYNDFFRKRISSFFFPFIQGGPDSSTFNGERINRF